MLAEANLNATLLHLSEWGLSDPTESMFLRSPHKLLIESHDMHQAQIEDS